jgi:hypothetical protein
MSDLPSTDELRQNEELLRKTITATLVPIPYLHGFPYTFSGSHELVLTCHKCGYKSEPGSYFDILANTPRNCPYPDAFLGSMVDAKEVLVKELPAEDIVHSLTCRHGGCAFGFEWWLKSDPVECVLFLLVKLGKARKEK